jgi:thiol:disulfide interchange protein DsbC
MLKTVLFITVLFISFPLLADEAEIRDKIQATLPPGMAIESIQPAADTGLYEAVINGDILYFTPDARYVFQGDLLSLETRINLTDERLVQVRQSLLEGLDEKQMIIFEPKKTDYTVTIFTDIDCGYCRKMHSEMEQYLAEGIRIRYLFFPRAGIGSESYDKAVAVWCNKDKQDAMTRAKRLETVDAKTCENPVADQYNIGRQLGVQGTPAMYLENGQSLPGYVPAAKLKQVLVENLG